MTRRCAERGFTFLEMLVVVSILAGIAMLAYATASEADDQRRYEDTQQRLLAIRRAALGVTEPAYDGQVRLSGFVADNGLLPTTIEDLATGDMLDGVDDDLLAAGGLLQLRSPRFDPQPDSATCINDGGEVAPAWGDGEKLFKGWRGSYLPMPPGVDRFRDAWGNNSPSGDDATNHGWGVTTSPLQVTSWGLNNAAGGTGYDADQSLAIDGEANLDGWTVAVRNNTGAGINNLRVSLLAYRNDGSANGQWKRVTSSRIDSLAAGATDTVSFNAYCNDGTSGGDSRAPQGRHLLVLVQDSDGTAHNGASEAVFDRDSTIANTQAYQAVFIAGVDRPSVTLEIR